MDRGEYLKLCQRRAMGDDGVTVRCAWGEYVPIGYRLGFDGHGKAIHTAILLDVKSGAHSVVYELLEKVEQVG